MLKLLIFSFISAFAFMFTYRVSQVHGSDAQYACGLAIWVSVIAGICSFLPVLLFRQAKDGVFYAAVLFSVGIRAVITLAGVIVFCLYVECDRGWFLSVTAIYYVIFLVIETLYAVKIVHSRLAVDNVKE